jgi:hypothetical protein
MTKILSVAAAFLTCSSMSIYVFRLIRGNTVPSPSTWITWFVIGLLNLASYLFVVERRFLQIVPLVFVVIGIAIVTAYASLRGRFSKPCRLDLVCLLSAFLVGIVWQVTRDPKIANLLLQLVYVVSFIPTIVGLKRGYLKEYPTPWLLALLAYAFMIAAIVVDWPNQSLVAFVHPVVNGVIGNGIVLYLVVRKKRGWISPLARSSFGRIRGKLDCYSSEESRGLATSSSTV